MSVYDEIKEKAFNDELQKIATVKALAQPGANYFMKSTKAIRQYKPNTKPAPKLKLAQTKAG
jgi:hypothetical protein